MNFFPVQARMHIKICLLAHKTLLSGKRKYLKSSLQPSTFRSLDVPSRGFVGFINNLTFYRLNDSSDITYRITFHVYKTL